MALATYKLEIDWNGNGLYDHAESEILKWISVQTRMGRDKASQLTGRSAAGSMSVVLRNEDGKYSPFNESSPIFGKIVPNRKVRLRTTAPSAQTLWSGFLDTIEPQPRLGGAHEATLRAKGPLSQLEEPRINVDPRSNILTGAAMGVVLDKAGWPAADRIIDAGNTLISRWVVEAGEEGEEALAAAHDVAEAEGRGFLRETRDGKIQLEDRRHRLKTDHLTVQATFSDIPGDPGAVGYFDVSPENAWAEVYNEVVARVQKQTVGSGATLWTLDQSGADSPKIEIGDSITFEAIYPGPGTPASNQEVDTWTTPALGTDVVANSQADGAGTNLTGSMAVSGVEKGANVMRFTVTNNAGQIAYLTLVQARGIALSRNIPVNVVHKNQASIDKYGRRTYPVPTKFISRVEDAKEYCEWVAAMFAEPIPVIAISFHAHRNAAHMTQALARDVSDRVRIKSDINTGLGIDYSYFIEAISHSIRDAGEVHIVTLELSPIEGFGRGWVLGVSELGVTTVPAV